MRQALIIIGLSLVCSSIGGAGTVLGAGDNGQLYTIDPATGATTAFPDPLGVTVSDIAWDPANGQLYAVNLALNSEWYGINETTGMATAVGATGIAYLNALVCGSAGVCYAAGGPSFQNLYTIKVATGVATLVGQVGTAFFSSGDLDFVNGVLYATSISTVSSDALWSIDTTTGAGTEIGSIGYANVYGLADNGNGTLYGFTNPTGSSSTGDVLTIDTSTGVGSLLATYDPAPKGAFDGVTDYTPEPGTIISLGAGLALMGGYTRKRSRSR